MSWLTIDFPDGTKVGLYGLKEVFEELSKKELSDEQSLVSELFSMLKDYGNYIPESKRAKKEYASVLLQKYKEFLKEKKAEGLA